MCALLNFAIGGLEDHDYARCLITCWVAIEALLNKRWNEYINNISHQTVDNGTKFINKNRMRKLKSHDYTASVMTEILSLSGRLSFQEYELIEIVRKTRNDWMHNLKDVSIDNAQIALRASSMLFHSKFDVELPAATSLRL